MSKAYILSRGASADLADIVTYTRGKWGEAQFQTYVEQLEGAALAVARAEGSFKDLAALHPHLRMTKSGRHYIFCLARPRPPAIILAILHERMDVMARLEKRLSF